ncbi:hypothetical protein KS4_23880 [Poriferisphaera corsica]|uniref:Uncharacterized protein n=1 Tax=Poriferisphaera corsica TaxID=2528020 RepID=A0A517YVS4_9BACT|nr:hypothetical protein [Poriferisphaera corsica]QDU34320.1 hypothetical protein KS4_23880 [Poriferisphaera corsica]
MVAKASKPERKELYKCKSHYARGVVYSNGEAEVFCPSFAECIFSTDQDEVYLNRSFSETWLAKEWCESVVRCLGDAGKTYLAQMSDYSEDIEHMRHVRYAGQPRYSNTDLEQKYELENGYLDYETV